MASQKGNSLLLIALSGGTPSERVEIADRLVSSGKGQFAAYAQATPSADYGLRRLEVLRAYLGNADEPSGSSSPVEGLVIAHCLTEQEAQEVRARGGVIWHLYSRPSGSVSIRQGDVMVTDGQAGFRHVREPLEALSELILSRLANSPSVRAALKGLTSD